MISERLSPERFAEAVARRLNAVVPAGFSVRSNGSAVSLYDPDTWGASLAADILTDDDDRTNVERIQTAAYAIVSFIQDEVMESTREPWPGGPPGGAMPEARVIGEQLHVWFGEEGDPILRLEPVDLTHLANGAA